MKLDASLGCPKHIVWPQATVELQQELARALDRNGAQSRWVISLAFDGVGEG
ncbi:MAG: hypothetical protein WAM02_07675 [Candidatus Cybelea sp.]